MSNMIKFGVRKLSVGKMASKRKSQRLEIVRGAIVTGAERDDKGLNKRKDRGCEEEGQAGGGTNNS